jgi:general secretion pathway protein G
MGMLTVLPAFSAKLQPRRIMPVSGFTLLELLVVVAIIGLLASYVGPRYFAQIGKSEVGVAKAQIDSFAKALDAYRLDHGRFPTTADGLEALRSKPQGGSAKWNGPYLQRDIPLDPWGKPYLYRSPGRKGDFEIQTLGKDGVVGGEGENRDIDAQF